MKNPYLLFDCLYILAAAIVYTVAGSSAFYIACGIWGDSVLSRVAAVLLGYFLFLHLFVLSIAGMRKLFQKPLNEGSFPIGMNKDYIAWGINSICHGIMIASPFASQIFFIFYLNWLYYNLMGMKLPLNSLIGTNTTIRQPELIEIGYRSVIGIGSTLSGHYSPNRQEHYHGKICIGNNSLVGAQSTLSPSVQIGDNTVIGSNTTIAANAIIGSNVKIGPCSFINLGARIPDNVIIKSNSVISAKMDIKPGDVWAGHPAVRINPSDSNPTETPANG